MFVVDHLASSSRPVIAEDENRPVLTIFIDKIIYMRISEPVAYLGFQWLTSL